MSPLGHRLARLLRVQAEVKSLAIATAMAGLAGTVSYLLLGFGGLLVTGMLVMLSAWLTGNGRWLLRLQRAQELDASSAPRLHRLVTDLARRAGLNAPHLFWLPTHTPNALATETKDGRGALAVSEGLLQRLNWVELEGVLAHEVSHLVSGDTRRRRWTSAATQSATTLLKISVWLGFITALVSGQGWAQWLLLLGASWLLPVAFGLMDSALSRTREFAADAAAAQLTQRPLALASALGKLERRPIPLLGLLLGGRRAPGPLDSHPSTAERIRRLRSLVERNSNEHPVPPSRRRYTRFGADPMWLRG